MDLARAANDKDDRVKNIVRENIQKLSRKEKMNCRMVTVKASLSFPMLLDGAAVSYGNISDGL